jgi:hypothetical protein
VFRSVPTTFKWPVSGAWRTPEGVAAYRSPICQLGQESMSYSAGKRPLEVAKQAGGNTDEACRVISFMDCRSRGLVAVPAVGRERCS